MPKKGASKLKHNIKNKRKKQRKVQKQNEEQQRKQQLKEMRDREKYHQKQQEEIEIVSTMYELKSVRTPGQTPQPHSSGNIQDTLGNDSEESEKYSNIFDMEVHARPGEMEKNHCSIKLRVRSLPCTLILTLSIYLNTPCQHMATHCIYGYLNGTQISA